MSSLLRTVGLMQRLERLIVHGRDRPVVDLICDGLFSKRGQPRIKYDELINILKYQAEYFEDPRLCPRITEVPSQDHAIILAKYRERIQHWNATSSRYQLPVP